MGLQSEAGLPEILPCACRPPCSAVGHVRTVPTWTRATVFLQLVRCRRRPLPEQASQDWQLDRKLLESWPKSPPVIPAGFAVVKHLSTQELPRERSSGPKSTNLRPTWAIVLPKISAWSTIDQVRPMAVDLVQNRGIFGQHLGKHMAQMFPASTNVCAHSIGDGASKSRFPRRLLGSRLKFLCTVRSLRFERDATERGTSARPKSPLRHVPIAHGNVR